jgi:alcohol dehydrogenase, propanol-preferring
VSMMRAALLGGHGEPLQITHLPRPEPGPGQVLIRLEASGVCHTDVHVWQGKARPATPPDPFILGHEGVGRIAALGAGVTDWAVGDPAGAAWLHDTCGVCDECRAGQESFCQNQLAHGFSVPGTFAEYVCVPAAHAVSLPGGDAPALAPLMCAGVTAFGAIERAALQPGETCAIFGCGGLGLYAVQLARRIGAKVIAIDPDPAKRAAAVAMGAAPDATLAPTTAHVCINFAPTPATWAPMVQGIRPRGRIIAAAMVAEPVPLDQEWLTATGVTITGTSVGTRDQMRRLMQMHGATPLQGQITEIALEDVTMALTLLSQGRAPGRFCIRF